MKKPTIAEFRKWLATHKSMRFERRHPCRCPLARAYQAMNPKLGMISVSQNTIVVEKTGRTLDTKLWEYAFVMAIDNLPLCLVRERKLSSKQALEALNSIAPRYRSVWRP